MWYKDYYDYDTYLHPDPTNMEGWETHPVPQSSSHPHRPSTATGTLMGRTVSFRILPPLQPGWRSTHRLVAVSQSDTFAMGLCSCGKVFFEGFLDWHDYERKCELVEWEGIVSIATGPDEVLGLRKDGTVVAAGYRKDAFVHSWRHIVQLSVGQAATLGLRRDGTVVASGSGAIEGTVTTWRDIVQVSAGDHFALGVRRDGTVAYADDYNDEFSCDVSGWTDIVQASAGPYHAAGVRRDGTVVTAECAMYWEFMKDVECLELSSLRDVAQVCAGDGFTAARLQDGTVFVVRNGTRRRPAQTITVLMDAAAISANRHFEGNDEVLALDTEGHAVMCSSGEMYPWDNWDVE